MTFDPLAILNLLLTYKVDFVVIGGIAGAAHGSPSVTSDLDVCYSREKANLVRLADALTEMKARLRGASKDVKFQLDARSLQVGDNFTFSTQFGDFDCFDHPAGTSGYSDLMAAAVSMDFDGIKVAIASVGDLIRMKRASGRPKDRVELEILGALKQEIEDL